ncbi:hypothetical protein ScPMuIL_008371 [Solemya velum]
MDMDIRQSHGYLEVYDGYFSRETLIAQTNGIGVTFGIEIARNLAYFKLTTLEASGETGTGFKVAYFVAKDHSGTSGGIHATLQPKFLTSPNFPDAYSPSLNLVWTIHSGGTVAIKVFYVDIPSGSDCTAGSLNIYNGNSIQSNRVARYCGSRIFPGDQHRSTGQSYTVSFISGQTTGQGRGFFVSYSSDIEDPDATTAKTTTVGNGGGTNTPPGPFSCPQRETIVAHPTKNEINLSGDISANSDCSWSIIGHGDWELLLDVRRLQTACPIGSTDFVLSVYDGTNANGALLQRFSCRESNTEGSVVTSSGSAFIRLQANAGINGVGLTVYYMLVMDKFGGTYSRDGTVLTVGDDVQYLSTPNFPYETPGNLNEIWAIDTRGADTFIQVEFMDMDANDECIGDSLLIYEASESDLMNRTPTVIATLCNVDDWQKKHYKVTKQYLGILFNSDSDGARRGFFLQFGKVSSTTTVSTRRTESTTTTPRSTMRTTPANGGDTPIGSLTCSTARQPLSAIPRAGKIRGSGDNLDCTWLITADSDWVVMLQVTDLRAACTHGTTGSVLSIYDGSDAGNDLLAEYDCSDTDGGEIVVATSGEAFIHLQTNAAVDLINVYYISVAEKSTGSYNLDGTIGSAEDTVQYISSVNFPSLYASDLQMIYAIDTGGQSGFIEVVFVDISPSAGCIHDNLQIYEATQAEVLSRTPTILTNLCVRQDWEPKYYPITKQYLGIVFMSDSQNNGRGFFLRYGLGVGTTPTTTVRTTKSSSTAATTTAGTGVSTGRTTTDSGTKPSTQDCSGQNSLVAQLTKKTIAVAHNMDESCSLVINAADGASIVLEIRKLQIPCTSSEAVIRLYDGNSASGTLLMQHLCGNTTPSELAIASSGQAFVEILGVSGTGQKSWEIFYLGSRDYSSKSFLVEGVINQATREPQFITSPNFPGEYEGSLQMAWAIDTGTNDDVTIIIEFYDMPSSPGCIGDGVQVMEGTQADLIARSPRLLGGHCGYQNWTRRIYKPTRQYVVIGFTSDATVSGKGFLLRYGLGDLSEITTTVAGPTDTTGGPVTERSSVKSDDDYTTYVAVAGGCLGALCLAAVLLFLFMKRRRYQNNHAKPKERQLSGHENPNFENGPEIDIYGDRGSSEKPYRRDTIPATDACGNIAPKRKTARKAIMDTDDRRL